MSLKQSIHFEPGVTPLALVLAAVQAAYGASTGLHIDDNPGTGTDDNDAGAGGSFDPNSTDANGLPWDERIHSGAKTRTAKGVWTKRKGVADTVIAQVTAELRARTPQAAQVSPAPVPQAQPAALQIGQPMTLAAPVVQAQPQPTPFESLMHFIADQQSKRPEFSASYVEQSLKSWGIVDANGNGSTVKLQELGADQIAQVRAAFAQALGLPAGA